MSKSRSTPEKVMEKKMTKDKKTKNMANKEIKFADTIIKARHSILVKGKSKSRDDD